VSNEFSIRLSFLEQNKNKRNRSNAHLTGKRVKANLRCAASPAKTACQPRRCLGDAAARPRLILSPRPIRSITARSTKRGDVHEALPLR